MSFVWLAVILAGPPLGAVAWVKWRFRPKQLGARADRIVREAEAKMEARSDDELLTFFRDHPYLGGPVAESTPARRIRALVERREFTRLAREWAGLWQQLLDVEVERAPKKKPELLSYSIDLNAAAMVLARRHPKRRST